jgi:hypothetical protein
MRFLTGLLMTTCLCVLCAVAGLTTPGKDRIEF